MRRRYTIDEIVYVYGMTDGYCFHCERKIALRNYGVPGARGAWEVDHGMPLSRGGVDDGRNWIPSCIPCNRAKGDMTTTEFRRWRALNY